MNRREFFQEVGARTRISPRAISSSSLFVGRSRAITSTLAPWVPGAGEWNATTIGHLYRRAGFSATMAEITAAQGRAPSDVVDALLDDTLTQDGKMPAAPAYSEQWLHQAYTGGRQQQADFANAIMSLRRNWTTQLAAPSTMLRERMCYLWLNHFVIEAAKVAFPQMIYHYLDYFRHNPWGNFKQMVKDVTVLPAMLYYLDGWTNVARHANENYGRELMELFTLGVLDENNQPNYTETDVHEMSKSFTGYTIDFTSTDPDVMLAKYVISRHDNTYKQPFAEYGAPKAPYGLASSGQAGVVDVIDLLFQYRADKLAYYICKLLYQFFVYYEVGDAENVIIEQMATTFQSNNWELKPVLAQLLKSEHFFDEGNIGAQIKGPFEWTVGLLRGLDVSIDDEVSGSLYYYAVGQGQSLFDPPNVKGWPGYHNWLSTTTLPYRNTVVGVLTKAGKLPGYGTNPYTSAKYPGVTFDSSSVMTWAAQFPDFKGDVTSFIQQMCQFLCAIQPSADLQKSLIQDPFVNPSYEWPGMDDATRADKISSMLGVILALPEYQLY